MRNRDLHNLLSQVEAAEDALRETAFLAPCMRGGQVRAKVEGLVYTFTPEPHDFEGWGIFRPLDERTARVTEEADFPQVMEYLALLPALRVYLVHPLQGQTWLAYPVNEADMKQRWGAARPLPVHLVTEGEAFEQVTVRYEGSTRWFEGVDRRADPALADGLRDLLRQVVPPERLHFRGLTPEARAAYDLAAQQSEAFAPLRQQRREEDRLRDALKLGGGQLRGYQNRRDYWVVEWTTRDGHRHTSAIGKRDLTVLSAGICLDGEDRKFDLQSLVGVVERRWD